MSFKMLDRRSLFMVAVASSVVGTCIASGPATALQPIPVVVGEPNALAYNTLKAAGFDAWQSFEPSTISEACKVMRTDPPGNTAAAAGSRVIMYVSSGPPSGNVNFGCPPAPTLPTQPMVPDVVGEQNSAAYTRLKSAGFDAWQSLEPGTATNVCKVIRTNPTANAKAVAGSRVIMYVSSGPPSSNVTYACPPVPTLSTQPPTIDSFTIAPRQITSGQSITIRWRVTPSPYCMVKVRLTQKNFHTDVVLAIRNGLDTSNMLSEHPEVDSNYFLDAACDAGQAATQRRISVGVVNPTTSSLYCFKVVYPTGICNTFAYPASTQSSAEQRARSENPTGSVTSIDCSQITNACGN